MCSLLWITHSPRVSLGPFPHWKEVPVGAVQVGKRWCRFLLTEWQIMSTWRNMFWLLVFWFFLDDLSGCVCGEQSDFSAHPPVNKPTGQNIHPSVVSSRPKVCGQPHQDLLVCFWSQTVFDPFTQIIGEEMYSFCVPKLLNHKHADYKPNQCEETFLFLYYIYFFNMVVRPVWCLISNGVSD